MTINWLGRPVYFETFNSAYGVSWAEWNDTNVPLTEDEIERFEQDNAHLVDEPTMNLFEAESYDID